jgi:pimeloyl-ACP methyl ester carboxylesterase
LRVLEIHGQKLLADPKRVSELKIAIQTTEPVQTLHDQERQLNALEAFIGVDYSKLTMPTTIGYGEEDLLSPPSIVKTLEKKILGSQVISFPGAHGLLLEALPEFLELMSEALCAVQRPGLIYKSINITSNPSYRKE